MSARKREQKRLFLARPIVERPVRLADVEGLGRALDQRRGARAVGERDLDRARAVFGPLEPFEARDRRRVEPRDDDSRDPRAGRRNQGGVGVVGGAQQAVAVEMGGPDRGVLDRPANDELEHLAIHQRAEEEMVQSRLPRFPSPPASPPREARKSEPFARKCQNHPRRRALLWRRSASCNAHATTRSAVVSGRSAAW